MLKLVERIAEALRPRYHPNPRRRREVVAFLSLRRARSDEEWHQDFAAERGVPLEFVRWFRDTCSRYFEYDLSAAVPEDRLVDDLGMYEATWGDVDRDIFEEFEGHFDAKVPADAQASIVTFGQLLNVLWSHAKSHTNVT